MKLLWTPRSLRNSREIADYIATENEAAAGRLIARIRRTADTLADHPLA
ncbi:type II toxin-antitoxin system RelE/ParE family toxin, partial [Bradyrhizobium sp. NBAIM03]|nr:type II toxin-antitoxin system RelE/ParE family toxin [Bradyrhizobium sp. NBAIM03]